MALRTLKETAIFRDMTWIGECKNMKKILIIPVALLFCLAGCAAFSGPCYQAAEFRRQAQNVDGMKKAELLGKADAAQCECDRQNKIINDQQRRQGNPAR
jgi:hypothetical protein